MLHFLDVLLTIVHLAIVLFNLLGWIPKRMRKAHLISIMVTAACWFLLGIWFGYGYCPVTDWQWRVKEALGERNMPGNFIEYFAEKISGYDFDSGFVQTVTGLSFAFVSVISIYLNVIASLLKKSKVRTD